MAKIRICKRKTTFIDLNDLVQVISNIGLTETLKKYYNQQLEHDAKSIVAGPSFTQYLNRLFETQVSARDILQFESADHIKFFMFSLTGTWDEIIKLQWSKGGFAYKSG